MGDGYRMGRRIRNAVIGAIGGGVVGAIAGPLVIGGFLWEFGIGPENPPELGLNEYTIKWAEIGSAIGAIAFSLIAFLDSGREGVERHSYTCPFCGTHDYNHELNRDCSEYINRYGGD